MVCSYDCCKFTNFIFNTSVWFSLFYLRGVAPPKVLTTDIYRGAAPYVFIQLLMLLILAIFPELATWLPSVLYK